MSGNSTQHINELHPVPYRPDEMSLCRLWNSGRLPSGCRTLSGESVSVIYRGQWSGGYGPDFRGAVLSLNGGPIRRGDVEIHVASSSWFAHGHHHNPLYENVILHVVWEVDAPPQTTAPVLELRYDISPNQLSSLPDIAGLDNHPCSVFDTSRTYVEAIRLVESAGDARFEGRCSTFEGELACWPAEQALYAGLMECMGYSENKLPFRLLAQAVPLDTLVGRPAVEVATNLRAASGLVRTVGSEAVLSPVQWKVSRVRPANHPLRRMVGMAELIARASQTSDLVDYLVSDPLSRRVDISARLQITAPDNKSYIGTDRAREATANVLLPFAVALARSHNDRELERRAIDAWHDLPRTSGTRVERLMREHIALPRGSRALSRARHQQGLIHLYKRFCAQRLCASCPLSKLSSEEPSYH